jgi:medium-chain acyl-[acyl-carrier-protein] hydrolase
MFGLARLDALFGCFQEAAGHHARDLGVGREHLDAQGCFWVLSRCWMRVRRYPAWGKEFVVRTWPQGVRRLFALRHFRLLDPDGEEFGSGISAWVILDAAKHRPVRPGPFLEHLVLTDEPGVDGDVLEKQPAVAEMPELGRLVVPYSDLDVNRHVNNAAYVRWILDSFGQEHHERHQISSIRIDYLAETLLGETISIQCHNDFANNAQAIVGLRGAGDVSRSLSGSPVVFHASIAWGDRAPGFSS